MPPRIKDDVVSDRNCSSHSIEINKQDPETKAWLFDDALQFIGFGKVQIMCIFICGLILSAVINETMGMMMIITPSQCDLQLSSTAKGMVSSTGFIGIMIPAYMWGYLADTKGRKKIMLFSLFCSNVAAVCSSVAPTFTVFLICRFVVGFFVSAASSSVYAYLGEFHINKHRSTVIAWASMSVGISALYIPAIAWLILSNDFRLPLFGAMDFRPWRLLLLAYTLPGFCAALMLTRFKESPRYFMAQGREEDALKVLQWMYVKNRKENVEFYPVKKLISEIEREQVTGKAAKGFTQIVKSMWDQTQPLLKKPLVIFLAINCYMMFAVFFASGGIGIWFADLQNTVSTSNISGTVCQLINYHPPHTNETIEADESCVDTIPTKVYIDSLILGTYYTVAVFIIAFIIRRVGRGYILAFGLFVSGICGLSLLWLEDPMITLTAFSIFIVNAGVSISVISNGVVALFPTKVRAMAVCIILMCGRLGTTVGSNIVGVFIESNCEATFAFFSIVVLVAACLNFFLPFR
ncbi:synaptic vesicle glycoprotein 2B-like [Culicoides brevitarsis]|uniref:synaptic vesicle glycoprotein 2B-like n=1 Tax=Culicoides brevitarsis TaxID=469753 RepID=UPI00307C7F4D